MKEYENAILPYPLQHLLTQVLRKEAKSRSDSEFMSLWAGQNAYLCQSLPVEKLIENLAEGLD